MTEEEKLELKVKEVKETAIELRDDIAEIKERTEKVSDTTGQLVKYVRVLLNHFEKEKEKKSVTL